MGLGSNIGAAIAAPVVLGANQQGLIDQLKQNAAGMFGGNSGVDMNDPASLRAEANRLASIGDQAGALRMSAAAQQLESSARSAATGNRAARAEQRGNIDRGQARVEAARASTDAGAAELAQHQSKVNTVKALEAKGLTQEAQAVRDGTLSPKEGQTILGEGRRDATAQAGEERRAKLATGKAQGQALAKAQEKTVTERKETVAAFRMLQQSNPAQFAKMVKAYGPIIKSENPAEVAVLHAISQRASFMGVDDDTGAEWEGSNATQRDIAYNDFDVRLNAMVGDNDLDGDKWGWDNNTDGYALLMAETINTVKKANNVPDAQAAEIVMQTMESLAKSGNVSGVAEMAAELEQAIRVGPGGNTDASDEDLLNKY